MLHSRNEPHHIVQDDGSTSRGLLGADARAFFQVVDGVHRALRPRNAVSHNSLQSVAFEWLFSDEPGTSLSDYCVRKAQELIEVRTVVIPVYELRIQSSFDVGDVTFEELTAERIAAWHKSEGYSKLAPEERPSVDAYFEDVAKRHQGRAIASIVVEAEKQQARVVALERVDDALAMLRFFSPASRTPYLRSTCVPAGRERKETFRAVFEQDGKFGGEQRGAIDMERAPPWNLSDHELDEYRRIGLERLSLLLRQPEPTTEFQERVLTSFRLHSEASLEVSVQTRLVLVLAALEGLYLVNPHEPIQQNVGERLAMMVEDDVDRRIAVVRLVRDVYGVRSKFVHHATAFDVTEELDHFSRHAWLGLVRALEHVDQCETLADFVGTIDRRRLSG